MKTIKTFNFIEKRDSQKLIDMRIEKSAMKECKGGDGGTPDDQTECNPWLDCDAWNCAPDCICKSNLA